MAGLLRDPTFGTPGRYEVGDVLATGGMATVHRAYDKLARREVAYKRLRISIEAHRPRVTALFRREYDTLARLEHPNIVSVYEFGVDGHGPYYAMELVAGDDLAKRGALPWREGCRIMRDVASALALVHARRLIHRDVSPNNVRLTASNDAKLIDFGALAPFGVPPEVVGTPPFVAPECLTHEPLDQRVDLYALGALAYYTLTRQLAVRAYSLEDLPQAWLQPIPPPSSLAADIPEELDDLILALLRRDRGSRPSTAGDVVERLTNIAALEPEQDERRVAFSYLRHPPLQGRAEILNSFALSLDALMSGRGGVVMIEGGPGSGRTAVLEQLGVDAQLRGATVLRAQGTVHKAPLDAAMHLVRTGLAVYPELAQQYRERHSSMVVEPKANAAAEATLRYNRLASYIQETLLQLGLRGPLVLLVDDAELIDAQSLNLLASMTEALGRHPILLALARLAAPATTDAAVVLQGAAQRVRLTPLSERNVTDLVQNMFGGVPNSVRLARWLCAEGGGNPAQCIRLVGWLLSRGAARYSRGTFTLPHDIEPDASLERGEGLQLERLASTGPGPVQLARLLALVSGALDLDALTQASGSPSESVLENLRTLRDASLLVESDGSYALASRALASAIASQLTSEERRPLHLALAHTLGNAIGASSLEKLAAAMHLIHAGGDEALRGALRIEEVSRAYDYELANSGTSIKPLEAALEVLERHGYTDRDCVHTLAMLTASGFYGDLEVQRRYLDRAMGAMWHMTGLSIAARLRRWLGPTLSLIVGLLLGSVREWLRPSRLPKWSFRRRLQGVLNTASPAVAAAACALDTVEAERIVRWLEPLAVARPNSAIQISRQFSLAVAETSAGNLTSAVPRYRHVLAHLQQPVRDLDESVRQNLRHGCLHGIAQAAVEDYPEQALEAAEELSHSPFFAPHAELIRMFHYGCRGERDKALEHRTRAEALALLGGVSWSAVVLINLRAFAVGLMTLDMLELVRANAEFERLAKLSPALAALQKLAQADLMYVRGRSREAVALYEPVLATEAGRRLPSIRVHLACYARALIEAGEPLKAKQLCERILSETPESVDFPLASHRYSFEQQLAQADAALGDHARAAERLDQLLARFEGTQNPLLLGSFHHERAQVALIASDLAAFDHHFQRSQALFQATHNQWLIQRCDALLTRAVRKGMRPAIPARALQAIEDSSTEMDGSTSIELRDTVSEGASTQVDATSTHVDVHPADAHEPSSRGSRSA